MIQKASSRGNSSSNSVY